MVLSGSGDIALMRLHTDQLSVTGHSNPEQSAARTEVSRKWPKQEVKDEKCGVSNWASTAYSSGC